MQNSIVISLDRDKECLGSVRFKTPDKKALVTNVYISRLAPGIQSARSVRVTIEVDPAPKAAQVPAPAAKRVTAPVPRVVEGSPVTDDAALLAAIG